MARAKIGSCEGELREIRDMDFKLQEFNVSKPHQPTVRVSLDSELGPMRKPHNHKPLNPWTLEPMKP